MENFLNRNEFEQLMGKETARERRMWVNHMKISKITAVRIHCCSKESALMVAVERVREK
jgi:hypothetical protein